MTRSGRATIAFALVLSVPGAGHADGLDAARVGRIEQTVTSFMARSGIPGMSVAIARDGAVVWSKGYGLADLENYVPATEATVYRTASMGKPMTATAAMALAERKQLDLDAPVQKYCPAYPVKHWPLTTRQLLAHQGGVRHYGGPRDQEEQFSTKHYRSAVEALVPFKDDPLRFEPGTDYLYSTYGYGVVGCVIEGVTGVPYLEAMRQLVFRPAGMSHTRDDDPAAIIEHRAAGYVRVDGTLQIAAYIDMSNKMAAGGFVTTASDLAGFGAAYLDCRLVSCATVEQMTRPSRLKDGTTVDNYGLGWAIDDTGTVLFHGGSTPGVSGMLYMLPGSRLVVAFVTNLELVPGRADAAAAIADILLGVTPDPAAEP